MKVICTQENLKTGLLTVGRIISSSNTLPILNNILISTNKGLLRITATNLEIAIITHTRCKVEEEGSVTVSGKTLTELISNLPNKNITLTKLEQNSELLIEVENYHTHIKTLPAEEFPLIPQKENTQTVIVKANEFKKSIDQVIQATATNQTQQELTGVLLNFQKNKLFTVATNRYRLAEKSQDIENIFEQEVILPQKTAQEISRVIGNQEVDLEVNISPTQIFFTLPETEVSSRLVDGVYPPYKQIIPNDFTNIVEVEKQKILAAIKAGSIFTQSTNTLNLEFSGEKQQIIINANSSDLGGGQIEVEAKIQGQGGSLILNSRYLLDCLQNIEEEKINIKLINDDMPCVITPVEKKDYLYLIMPIKI